MRIGIVGAGFIGAVHARSARLADGQLIAVTASTPESAEVAARRLGAQRAARSGTELAEDPEIDVLHICAPNHLHAELTEAALARGKHVICEKPLALDEEQARRVTDLAERSSRLGAVPFVYRFYPMVREARARVAAGDLGSLRLIHGTYLQDWLAGPADTNWRVDPNLGGSSRAFADIGAHWCDLAEFVSGQRLTRLAARTINFMPERPVAAGQRPFERGGAADGGGAATQPTPTEDAITLQFETSGGAFGSLVVSQVSPGRKNRIWLELAGAEQSLAFDQERPESLWVGSQAGTEVVLRDSTQLGEQASRYSILPAGHPQGYGDCFDAFVSDCYTAIREEQVPEGLPLFADGLRAVQLTAAVMQSSSRGGTWVGVAEPAYVGSAAAPGTASLEGEQ